MEVYLGLVNGFPWAVISPSVHCILAHNWEVIGLNGGDQSEEGLEALNKLIRQMRAKRARKDSNVHNFRDTFYHCTMRFPMSIDILEIHKCKKSFLAHFIVKSIHSFFR